MSGTGSQCHCSVPQSAEDWHASRNPRRSRSYAINHGRVSRPTALTQPDSGAESIIRRMGALRRSTCRFRMVGHPESIHMSEKSPSRGSACDRCRPGDYPRLVAKGRSTLRRNRGFPAPVSTSGPRRWLALMAVSSILAGSAAPFFSPRSRSSFRLDRAL